MFCDNCRKELETLTGAAFEITGWERDRAAGGTNHVLWRERSGKVICNECVVRKLALGDVHEGQQVLV